MIKFLLSILLVSNVLWADVAKKNHKKANHQDEKVSVDPINVKINNKWTIDSAHTSVEFKVRHLGISTVKGLFSNFNGQVSTNIDLAQIKSASQDDVTDFTKIDFSKTKVSATIDVNSIHTENEKRDGHLKSEDFFNVAKFPKITFESTGFKNAKADSIDMVGNLTIRGTTKSIVLKVEDLKKAKNPQGGYNIGMSASTTLDRLLFGIKWNKLVEGISAVSKEVKVAIQVELMQAE